VKGLDNPGFPIVEVQEDGTFTVTKHANTGGVVNVASVTEQLVYEMGDPKNYITPDGVADFTSIHLKQAGRDRVAVSGIHGAPRTDKLKVSIAWFYGYKAVGTLVYSWPDAYEKAKRADQVLRARLKGPRPQVRDRAHGIRRCRCDSRQARRAAAPRPRGSPASDRCPGEGEGAGRAVRTRDSAIGADRPAERDRVRGRQAGCSGNRGVLAGVDRSS
jgi:hypothetical protein